MLLEWKSSFDIGLFKILRLVLVHLVLSYYITRSSVSWPIPNKSRFDNDWVLDSFLGRPHVLCENSPPLLLLSCPYRGELLKTRERWWVKLGRGLLFGAEHPLCDAGQSTWPVSSNNHLSHCSVLVIRFQWVSIEKTVFALRPMFFRAKPQSTVMAFWIIACLWCLWRQ